MALMAMDNHASLHIEPEDTVVISARLIPGNERSVGHMINHLLRRGAYVLYEKNANVHVSGHGAQKDLKLMMNLVRPKFFVPMHGAYSNLAHHAELAETVGISPCAVNRHIDLAKKRCKPAHLIFVRMGDDAFNLIFIIG